MKILRHVSVKTLLGKRKHQWTSKQWMLQRKKHTRRMADNRLVKVIRDKCPNDSQVEDTAEKMGVT